ncbi:Na+-transporting NADH:ubiquinone oxidoreductase subunit A [Sinobacterium caligoides]|uniref:Na(+)-translocating NADH-quinone reductase subunit A n=1 Tax=Sinobacterium caligoides TaxID=933926 RepID=A0A3N2DKH2_9GAMM|nr:Na(+)-translocating NADH-quinone reductase subunit A [Sinobacterium caligoides]ROS00301.1 Na+-transporting NADH:ubiquinone oxidoreductase subunit A [Sinobacterium caligoides]
MINIKRGLDLPISGAPEQVIVDAADVRHVALIGYDYIGMKPTMAVKVGDQVKLGQLLFSDKKTEGVKYTAPGAGKVVAINRGAKRVFQSLVIELDGNEKEQFAKYAESELSGLNREQVVDNLVDSGLWTALRTRPYSKVPAVDSEAKAIFVTAMDTSPLAADAAVIIAEKKQAFSNGLAVLSTLTAGKVFVCKAPGADIPAGQGDVVTEEFSGPHPAGLAGTHIHYLAPAASVDQTVWSINYQDVIAVGQLFVDGELNSERVIALAGPVVNKPRLLRTRLGASTDELTAGELAAGDNRVISGSVLSGRKVINETAFLGRYHQQISALSNTPERPTFHFFRAGVNRHSVTGSYISRFMKKTFDFTTTANGSERSMVPIGTYERVMPLDILPTQLIRALVTGDLALAQQLGALELDEEDLALCTYACPVKYEYGQILRSNLTKIEEEG